MIVTRLDTRPATAKSRQPLASHCMTIIDRFNQQPTAHSHHRKSSAVLPVFSDLPAKDFTQLFYSKFKVKGLPVESSRTHSKHNRSQKKLTSNWRCLPVDVGEVARVPRREETLTSQLQSFFRDGTTAKKKTRPVTAKGSLQRTETAPPSRPLTAFKPRQTRPPKEKLLSDEKETRITASLSNTTLLHERSARTIYEKFSRTVQHNNFAGNPSLMKKKYCREILGKDITPIKALDSDRKHTEVLIADYSEIQPKHIEQPQQQSESFEVIDLQEVLSKASARNQQHLRYLEDQQFDQYSKFLKSQAEENNGVLPANIDRELKQFNNTIVKDDSERLDYYLELTSKIQSVQDKLERVLQNKTVVAQPAAAEPASQLLSLDEYEEVVRLFDQPTKNLETLDELLVKLQPLKILSKERRLAILSIASLRTIQPETHIIERNSQPQFVFMVVRGSLEKHELQRICGMDFNLTKSIFDGETFGLADGDSDTNSRLIYSYAVVSKEQSTLLCIPYQQYVCIQSEFLKSELSVKVEALQQLECFQSMPAKDLIPLATLLTDKRFSNGDVMLKEGMPANKLYLMVKGSATIVKEEVVVRKKQQRPNGFADQPFSNCNSTNNIRQPVCHKKSAKFIGKFTDGARNQHKYKLLAEDDKKIAYYYFHEFKDVRKGEQLVYRAVAAGLDSGATGSSAFQKEPLLKLSVIANSNDCELFVLASEDVRKVPEYLLGPLLKYCSEHVDYDMFFNDKQNMKLKKWEQYKSSLCEQIVSRKVYTRKDGWMG